MYVFQSGVVQSKKGNNLTYFFLNQKSTFNLLLLQKNAEFFFAGKEPSFPESYGLWTR